LDSRIGQSLCVLLQHNTSLFILYLSIKNLETPNIVEIAMGLQANTSIRYLDLSRMKVCNEGAVALAEALRHNQSLMSLHLNTNEITDEGACALATTIHLYNRFLIDLNLIGNIVRESGIKALAKSLQYNTVLLSLGIETDYTTDHHPILQLLDALYYNNVLCSLTITCMDTQPPLRIRDKVTDLLDYNDTLQSITWNKTTLYTSTDKRYAPKKGTMERYDTFIWLLSSWIYQVIKR
jgi:Ran GTPase-activating protein (RanGAP) involved in mRNA processing and transport